jgi:hypothetical protein
MVAGDGNALRDGRWSRTSDAVAEADARTFEGDRQDGLDVDVDACVA